MAFAIIAREAALLSNIIKAYTAEADRTRVSLLILLFPH
jgi:hypothetical protein